MGAMRSPWALALLTMMPLLSQSSVEREVIATVQKTFDAMAAHDAAAIRSTMLPDARLFAVRDSAAPGAGVPVGDFADQIGSMKGDLLERFIGEPRVLIHGRMAQVWGEYEFLRDGKFNHCGVDSVSLFKTNEGWKIATIVYTAETTGCGNKIGERQ